MLSQKIVSCIRESQVDTIEVALKKRIEDLISEGDIEQAEAVEDTINDLDMIPVC